MLLKCLNYGSEHNTNKNTNCGPISKNCGPISENPNMVCIIFFLSIYFLPQFYSFFQKSENKTGEWYVLYFFPQSLFSLIEYFRPKIYLLPQFHNRKSYICNQSQSLIRDRKVSRKKSGRWSFESEIKTTAKWIAASCLASEKFFTQNFLKRSNI